MFKKYKGKVEIHLAEAKVLSSKRKISFG